MSERAGQTELAFDESDKEGRAILEIYLQRYNQEFKPIGYDYKPELTEYQVDKCNNKIYEDNNGTKPTFPKRSTQCVQRDFFKQIAQKIEENAELFAEIESTSRNMAADKVKSYDIKLIAKEFLHYSELQCPLLEDSVVEYGFNFTSDMPLCTLALLARRMRQNASIHVISKDVDCSVVLHLFVELCRKAGYPSIAWSFRPNVKSSDNALKRAMSGGAGGSVGVVTQSADVDSAVECLKDATWDYRYGWRLRRVLVQENVYDRFRRALTRSSGAVPRDFLEDLTPSADDVTSTDSVKLEAYRTTKELMALLRRYNPQYLSLWCSNISVCNEVALAVDCSVWINDYACLQGTHLKSHSSGMIDDLRRLMQKGLYYRALKEPGKEALTCEQLISIRTEWLKSSVNRRRDVVLKILRGCSDLSFNLDQIIEDLVKWEPNTFVSVENGTLYQGFQGPRGIVGIAIHDELECYLSLILQSLVAGNGFLFIIKSYEDKNILDLCESLSKGGVAVMIERIGDDGKLLLQLGVDLLIGSDEPLDGVARSLFKTRVISCHYGETFAN